MNTNQLLANLRKERDQIENAINFIERMMKKNHIKNKHEAIVEGVVEKKKKHWTQTAAGRRKMSRIQKAAWARKPRV